jgi:uncharacterized protein YbgA (DUF1722 family)
MGNLVADADKQDWEEMTAEYGAMLVEGLKVTGNRSKHFNVLQHLMGFPEESPVEPRQGVPSARWSCRASSRTIAWGWCH